MVAAYEFDGEVYNRVGGERNSSVAPACHGGLMVLTKSQLKVYRTAYNRLNDDVEAAHERLERDPGHIDASAAPSMRLRASCWNCFPGAMTTDCPSSL